MSILISVIIMKLLDSFFWKLGECVYNHRRLSILLPDKVYLSHYWVHCMGAKIDFHFPITFNEKLQWLKLYNRNPLFTKLVDKRAVKDWVKNVIGEEYVIPTLSVFDSIKQIDPESLPSQFVLKCTHDSGSVYVCSDKNNFDFPAAIQGLSKSLSRNYFWEGREWPYKNVSHKIILEQYISNRDNSDLKDYKFFCFNGVIKCFKIDFDRDTKHRANYYDMNYNLLPFGEAVCPPDFSKKLTIPSNIGVIIDLVSKIAAKIPSPFERIDFYDVDGHPYFGEITFFPCGGHGLFTDSEWDKILGDWIDLS